MECEQYVNLEINKSSIQKIEYGIPQGSILGIPLYLINANGTGNCAL